MCWDQEWYVFRFTKSPPPHEVLETKECQWKTMRNRNVRVDTVRKVTRVGLTKSWGHHRTMVHSKLEVDQYTKVRLYTFAPRPTSGHYGYTCASRISPPRSTQVAATAPTARHFPSLALEAGPRQHEDRLADAPPSR